jgi:hypothetical protein
LGFGSRLIRVARVGVFVDLEVESYKGWFINVNLGDGFLG